MNIIDRITRWRRLLLGIAAAYVLAWGLPTLKFDIMGSATVYRGPRATMAALSGANHWWATVLSVVSALTNLVFVIVFVLAWRWMSTAAGTAVAPRSTRLVRSAIWAVCASAVLNLWWLSAFDRGDLRSGYYLWVLSFFALAFVLVWWRRRGTVARGSAAGVEHQPSLARQ